ncbi:MAG: hypothetical protein ABL907_12200 [Hyphomicrobium sp.]
MSSLWDVPTYLIMAFSLALDAPAGKASRVSFENQGAPAAAPLGSGEPTSRGRLGDEVWLRAVKTAAPASDILQVFGARIFVTSTDRYYIPALTDRDEILSLQNNASVAVRVLAAATSAHKRQLESETGRLPSRGALLVAHLYGSAAAQRYVRAMSGNCERPARAAVPALAPALGEGGGLTLCALDRRLARLLREGGPAMADKAATSKGAMRSANFKGTVVKGDTTERPAVALVAEQ